jgi:hypothetical protein
MWLPTSCCECARVVTHFRFNTFVILTPPPPPLADQVRQAETEALLLLAPSTTNGRGAPGSGRGRYGGGSSSSGGGNSGGGGTAAAVKHGSQAGAAGGSTRRKSRAHNIRKEGPELEPWVETSPLSFLAVSSSLRLGRAVRWGILLLRLVGYSFSSSVGFFFWLSGNQANLGARARAACCVIGGE